MNPHTVENHGSHTLVALTFCLETGVWQEQGAARQAGPGSNPSYRQKAWNTKYVWESGVSVWLVSPRTSKQEKADLESLRTLIGNSKSVRRRKKKIAKLNVMNLISQLNCPSLFIKLQLLIGVCADLALVLQV